MKKAQEDAASTPRSVSAMTRIALPQIVSDFPDFQYDEMKQRAENALTQYLQAVTAQNVEILREGNEDLKEQLCSQISASVTLEQSRYNTDLVYIQNRALAKDAADNAIGITCPNCGAPVTNLGAKFCEYCGAGIIELNVHAWSFENIEEA